MYGHNIVVQRQFEPAGKKFCRFFCLTLEITKHYLKMMMLAKTNYYGFFQFA
jgi:hypothetical protein